MTLHKITPNKTMSEGIPVTSAKQVADVTGCSYMKAWRELDKEKGKNVLLTNEWILLR